MIHPFLPLPVVVADPLITKVERATLAIMCSYREVNVNYRPVNETACPPMLVKTAMWNLG